MADTEQNIRQSEAASGWLQDISFPSVLADGIWTKLRAQLLRHEWQHSSRMFWLNLQTVGGDVVAIFVQVTEQTRTL